MSSRFFAWAVHLYTAIGAVLALLAIQAIFQGAYAGAFLYMAIATFIDSTDGTLARAARVKEVLPEFDGARLDDIVDYLNYVVVPILLAYNAPGLLLPGPLGVVLASLPLLASGYGFCQADAKTPDHFFTGFPSYWNIVVFYMYVLGSPAWFNAVLLTFLAMMVFVPMRYLYPSRWKKGRVFTYALGIVWAVMMFALILQFPEPSRTLAVCSLFFPAYYVLVSLGLHFLHPPSPAR